MRAINIKIDPPLTNIRLADLLDAIVKVADAPVKYSIEDYCIVFSLRGRETTPLYIRTFKVDPNVLLQNLHVARGPAGTNESAAVVTALRERLAKDGVELDPVKNPGKALFYNDRQGMLLVRATLADLDLIEAEIAVMNTAPPQINIKAKFVEVSQDDTKALGFDWYLGSVLTADGSRGAQVGTSPSSNGPPSTANPQGVFPSAPVPATNSQPLASSPAPTLTGILTEPQYRTVLKALQQRQGAELLAQPEITTTSGRQVQMKATTVKSIITGFGSSQAQNTGTSTGTGTTANQAQPTVVYPIPEQMELGPVLDVIPCVLSDGFTINLTLIPTLTEFAGYDNPNEVGAGGNNQPVSGGLIMVPTVLPHFTVRKVVSTVNVWDGQTVVLVCPLFRGESRNTQKRNLLIFITPTIIDPAGNRVHAAEDTPSAREVIPPQPAR
jgi:type II secretory pathway component GspD/PulD (secretin)